MKKRLEKIVPPGYAAENILIFWCLGSIICVMIAMGFMLDFEKDMRFPGRIDDFVEYFGDKRIYYLTYGHIRERCFSLLALGLLAFVPMHYSYYFRESKSIYTMRRLGRPLELHIRAWFLPLRLSISTLILRAIVIAALFCYYLCRTGNMNHLYAQWEAVWRLIIYDRN